MKIKLTSEQIYASIIIFVLGLGFWMALPQFEKSADYVKLGTVSTDLAPESVVQEYGTPKLVTVPVSWSAPWVGSCYLTIDVRPEGAEKGEPETPEWDQNHLIRAKYDQRWWTQKWINIHVLQEREGSAQLKFAIIDSNSTKIDVYSELKCDDRTLSETKTTIEYGS